MGRRFTAQELEYSRKTDLAAMLLSKGAALKRCGSEYQWNNNGEKVSIRGNLWYSHYRQRGGDTISFVREYYNKSFPEAIEYLLNSESAHISQGEANRRNETPFMLPKRYSNMNRVFAYLINERGIDRDILREFVYHNMIYESEDHHNAVFVGYDLRGRTLHAHKHSTGRKGTYKMTVSGSQAEFAFHLYGTGDELYYFEAPIDLLSYITMHPNNWRSNTYAAACSVSDKLLFRCLKDKPEIKKVYLCFDNDTAGQNAAERISKQLEILRIDCEILVPVNKDWNEDLLEKRKEHSNE